MKKPSSTPPTVTDTRELAYLYDLFIVPGWREYFDAMVDAEIKLPKEAQPGWSALEAACGTGGYGLSLAARLGPRARVIGLDTSPERIEIARGKAEIQHLRHLAYACEDITDDAQPADAFALVIGDASMRFATPADQPRDIFPSLARVTRPGGAVVVKLATRGSFDEFFSLYWEALFEADLTNLTPQLEALISARLTTADVEQQMRAAGLQNIRVITEKQAFEYENAAEFMAMPVIERFFLPDWLAILPGPAESAAVRQHLLEIIDRERQDLTFDLSVRATLALGTKPED
ncbi:MAG: class I SAM-dependent methyltransferase [Blastocatellia bacterium]